MESQSAWELIRAHLNQPEYLHVLLNPLPVYGLALGELALLLALCLRSRAAQIVALTLVLISAASAWPVIHYGEAAYDRALTLNETSSRWLDAHAQRAERAEPAFYLLAALTAAALFLPAKFPKSAFPLCLTTAGAALIVLGLGGWIALAGGQVRHHEFRAGLPPEPAGGYEKMLK